MFISRDSFQPPLIRLDFVWASVKRQRREILLTFLSFSLINNISYINRWNIFGFYCSDLWLQFKKDSKWMYSLIFHLSTFNKQLIRPTMSNTLVFYSRCVHFFIMYTLKHQCSYSCHVIIFYYFSHFRITAECPPILIRLHSSDEHLTFLDFPFLSQ